MGWSSVDWMHFLCPLRFTASSQGQWHPILQMETLKLFEAQVTAATKECPTPTVLMADLGGVSQQLCSEQLEQVWWGWRTPEPCWEDIPWGLPGDGEGGSSSLKHILKRRQEACRQTKHFPFITRACECCKLESNVCFICVELTFFLLWLVEKLAS